MSEYIDLTLILSFVDRTVARGVPVRVALSRAAKHYSVPRDWVLAAYRTSEMSLRRPGDPPDDYRTSNEALLEPH